MAEQKMTYQERKQKVAEILAADDFPAWAMAKLDVSDSCRAAWQISVRRNMSKAIDMVASQAESIRWALQPYRTNGFISDLLLEHGYIEPKTENDAEK